MAEQANNTDKVILGIDPGTTVMGYGVIRIEGKQLHLETLGAIQLSKYKDHMLRLKSIFERTLYLIEQYKPDEFAIEAQFFGKNVQSMLKLGRAQGIAISAALHRNIPIFEYAPKKIKQSITGSGSASKEQVARMLSSIFKFEDIPRFLDATDGLAVALTHHYATVHPIPGANGQKGNSWEAFIKANPDKVKKR